MRLRENDRLEALIDAVMAVIRANGTRATVAGDFGSDTSRDR